MSLASTVIVVGAAAPPGSDTLDNSKQFCEAAASMLRDVLPGPVAILCFDEMYPFAGDLGYARYLNCNLGAGPGSVPGLESLDRKAPCVVVDFTGATTPDWACRNEKFGLLSSLEGFETVCHLPCGCGWDDGFPVFSVADVLRARVNTPCRRDGVRDVEAYLETLESLGEGRELVVRGAHHSVGTMVCRGYEGDRAPEQLVRDLLLAPRFHWISALPEHAEAVASFICDDVPFNALPRDLKARLHAALFPGVNF